MLSCQVSRNFVWEKFLKFATFGVEEGKRRCIWSPFRQEISWQRFINKGWRHPVAWQAQPYGIRWWEECWQIQLFSCVRWMELSTRTGDDTTLKAVPLGPWKVARETPAVRSFRGVLPWCVRSTCSAICELCSMHTISLRYHTIICMVHKVMHYGYIYALFRFFIFYPHSGKQYTMAYMYSMYAMFYIVCVWAMLIHVSLWNVCVYTVWDVYGSRSMACADGISCNLCAAHAWWDVCIWLYLCIGMLRICVTKTV